MTATGTTKLQHAIDRSGHNRLFLHEKMLFLKGLSDGIAGSLKNTLRPTRASNSIPDYHFLSMVI